MPQSTPSYNTAKFPQNDRKELFSSAQNPETMLEFGKTVRIQCDLNVMGDFVINYWCTVFNADNGDDAPVKARFFRFPFTTLFVMCPEGGTKSVRAAKKELDLAVANDRLSEKFCLSLEFGECTRIASPRSQDQVFKLSRSFDNRSWSVLDMPPTLVRGEEGQSQLLDPIRQRARVLGFTQGGRNF